MALTGGGLSPAFDCSVFSSSLSCSSSNHGPYHRHCNCSLHVLSSFRRSRRGRRSTQVKIPGKAPKSAGSGGCLGLSITGTAAAGGAGAKSLANHTGSGCRGCSSGLRNAIKELCKQVDGAVLGPARTSSAHAQQAGEEQIFDSLSYLSEIYSVVVAAADHPRKQQ